MQEALPTVFHIEPKYLDEWNDRRSELADLYGRLLNDSGVLFPVVPEWAEPAWHLYVVLCNDRDILQRCLSDAGIGTMIHYPIPPHLQPAYNELNMCAGAFPLSEQISRQILSLPMGPHLTVKEATFVADIVRGYTLSKISYA